MCNLSKGVWEWALQEGIEQGIQQKNMSLIQIMLESKEPLDKIMKYTGYSKEKIDEIAAMMGN